MQINSNVSESETDISKIDHDIDTTAAKIKEKRTKDVKEEVAEKFRDGNMRDSIHQLSIPASKEIIEIVVSETKRNVRDYLEQQQNASPEPARTSDPDSAPEPEPEAQPKNLTGYYECWIFEDKASFDQIKDNNSYPSADLSD